MGQAARPPARPERGGSTCDRGCGGTASLLPRLHSVSKRERERERETERERECVWVRRRSTLGLAFIRAKHMRSVCAENCNAQ